MGFWGFGVVDPVKIWHAVVDHIPEIVASLKRVLRRINENHSLVKDTYLQGNEEDVHLLVQDHDDVAELETAVVLALQRHLVELILGAGHVVVQPDLLGLGSEQNVINLLLLLRTLLTGSFLVVEHLVAFVESHVEWLHLLVFRGGLSAVAAGFDVFLLQVLHVVAVVDQLNHLVVRIRVNSVLIVLFSNVRRDQRPNDSDDSGTHTALGKELQLQLLHAQHLIVDVAALQLVVVQALVLWLGNL